MLISLDIETYGMCEKGWTKRPLPEQTLFHPQRSLATDGVHPDDLVLTCSITLPSDPLPPVSTNSKSMPPPERGSNASPSGSMRSICSGPSLRDWPLRRHKFSAFSQLLGMNPGPSMVLRMNREQDRIILATWLRTASAILGKNLKFDIEYLRAFDPRFREVLDGRQTLVDLSVLQFLYNEALLRSVNSLKAVGPAFGLFTYDKRGLPDKPPYYEFPGDKRMLKYNMEDTHNTLVAAARYVQLIHYEAEEHKGHYPGTAMKLSEWTTAFYSGLQWACIRMEEAGVPMDIERLEQYERSMKSTCAALDAEIEERWDVKMHGEGSIKSKRIAFDRALAKCGHERCKEVLGVDSIWESKMFEITDKKKEASLAIQNIRLIQSVLPKDDPDHELFTKWVESVHASKLISSFTKPLLRHSASKKSPHNSVLIRCSHTSPTVPSPSSPVVSSPGRSSAVAFGFPTIYTTPTKVDDESSEEGGQQQVRVSFKNPASQTFPRKIKSLRVSRFVGGSLREYDLSQIELRTAAVESGEPSLVNNYREGKDLHTARTVWIFGSDAVTRTDFKDLRQIGKTMNFTDLYLAGAAKMQALLLKTTGRIYPISLFEDVVASRSRLRPKLVEYQQRLMQEANQYHKITLPLTGHSRMFNGGTKFHKPNEMVNFPIQANAAIVCTDIANHAHRELPPMRLLDAPVVLFQYTHDSLSFDVAPGYEAECDSIVKNAVHWTMTDGYWARLCEFRKNQVPLGYDATLHFSDINGVRVSVYDAAGSKFGSAVNTDTGEKIKDESLLKAIAERMAA